MKHIPVSTHTEFEIFIFAMEWAAFVFAYNPKSILVPTLVLKERISEMLQLELNHMTCVDKQKEK